MNLTGNTVLITGGATGIGQALTNAFINLGNTVLTCGRTQATLELAKQRCPQLITYRCDISNEDERSVMLDKIHNDGYKINILINNAATVSVHDLSNTDSSVMSDIKKDIAINMIGPMELVNDLLPNFKQLPDASIININSPAAVVPIAKIAAYSAAKAGLLSYSRSLRYFLKNNNINVIDVFPPGVQTSMTQVVNTGRKQLSTNDFADRLIRKLQQGNDEIWIGESKIIRFLTHFSSRWLFNFANNPLSLDD